MNKHLVRFVSMLLAPCLLLNPAYASGLQGAFPGTQTCSASRSDTLCRFQDEALQLSALCEKIPLLHGAISKRAGLVTQVKRFRQSWHRDPLLKEIQKEFRMRWWNLAGRIAIIVPWVMPFPVQAARFIDQWVALRSHIHMPYWLLPSIASLIATRPIRAWLKKQLGIMSIRFEAKVQERGVTNVWTASPISEIHAATDHPGDDIQEGTKALRYRYIEFAPRGAEYAAYTLSALYLLHFHLAAGAILVGVSGFLVYLSHRSHRRSDKDRRQAQLMEERLRKLRYYLRFSGIRWLQGSRQGQRASQQYKAVLSDHVKANIDLESHLQAQAALDDFQTVFVHGVLPGILTVIFHMSWGTALLFYMGSFLLSQGPAKALRLYRDLDVDRLVSMSRRKKLPMYLDGKRPKNPRTGPFIDPVVRLLDVPVFDAKPLSVILNPGEITFFVEPDTPILDWLAGLQPPLAGQILIGNSAPTDSEVRYDTVFVPKDMLLFRGATIRENFEFRLGKVTNEEILQTLEMVAPNGHPWDLGTPREKLDDRMQRLVFLAINILAVQRGERLLLLENPETDLRPSDWLRIDAILETLRQMDNPPTIIVATHALAFTHDGPHRHVIRRHTILEPPRVEQPMGVARSA